MNHPASSADESVLDRDECHLVLDALARLGDTDAEVLSLVAWEHLTVAEIAAVLGSGPNAVAQRLHRARVKLGREYRRLQSRSITKPIAPEGGGR
jgi:RNA polymerase sigma-70 factor (ECF subfamily)